MDTFDENIKRIDKVICENIARQEALGNGLLSQNILAQLRNFTEAAALKIYSVDHVTSCEYKELQKALKYVYSRDEFIFLSRLHKCLQISASHYTIEPEASVRLMWKYYDYLQQMRRYLKETFALDVLENLDAYPLEKSGELQEYYRKIAEQTDAVKIREPESGFTEGYYIYQQKPFSVNGKDYYEVTLAPTHDLGSKFDRVIAFTTLRIPHFYAVDLRLTEREITVLNKKATIKIIDYFRVSVRPCEFKNFLKILGISEKIERDQNEYKEWMRYLSETGLNLVEVLDLDDRRFEKLEERIRQKTRHIPILNGLKKCRDLAGHPGSRMIRYLLYGLRNKIIRAQYSSFPCQQLSDLFLHPGCIPFDTMPYAFYPKKHITRLADLFECIDPRGREHEILARLIKCNTEIRAKLYTNIKDIHGFDNIPGLIDRYNGRLYEGHKSESSLCLEGNFLYINGYENNTIKIIYRLIELAGEGADGYEEAVNEWLAGGAVPVECEEKRNALKKMFRASRVALIYGAAGTGKSTLLYYISAFFKDKKKIYLSTTNAAVENLKRTVKTETDKSRFMTVDKFLYRGEYDCDILFIDECSTLSNENMAKVLNLTRCEFLVLAGDVFQIESIRFGNWFTLAKSYISQDAVCELTSAYRSDRKELLDLWKSVRYLDGKIEECLEKNAYSSEFDASVFEKKDEDEIVLCLNYDGLYGINNVNVFLQDDNPNPSVRWGIERYKAGDPVIFNESQRFEPWLYNNLKGVIKTVEIIEEKIVFCIEVDAVLKEEEADSADLEVLGVSGGRTQVRFSVNRRVGNDNDDDPVDNTVVPFQVAYAVSIHKAQGLEYNSVKIIIPYEIGDRISHNIFYTAITRTKNKLKIYWTPRTEKKVLSSLKFVYNNEDAVILAKKYRLKLVE